MEPIIIRIWPLIQWSSITFLAAKFSDVNTVIFDNVALNVHLFSYVLLPLWKMHHKSYPSHLYWFFSCRNDFTYVGLTKIQNNWRFTDSSFYDFHPNEAVMNGNEDCAVLKHEGFSSVSCGLEYPYLCRSATLTSTVFAYSFSVSLFIDLGIKIWSDIINDENRFIIYYMKV